MLPVTDISPGLQLCPTMGQPNSILQDKQRLLDRLTVGKPTCQQQTMQCMGPSVCVYHITAPIASCSWSATNDKAYNVNGQQLCPPTTQNWYTGT
jgi:hypothetical protein